MLAEADAGRGVVLLDCQGDLARNVLDRLPASCGRRLVILDPAETLAPPAWNVLAPVNPTGAGTDPYDELVGREWAAENVVGVFRRLYAAWWGPRMDDVSAPLPDLGAAARLHPGRRSAVVDLDHFRRDVVGEYGEPEGWTGSGPGSTTCPPGNAPNSCAPICPGSRGPRPPVRP